MTSIIQGGTRIMRNFYEMFLSANEDWEQSSIMYNARRRAGKKKCGKFVWKMLKTLKEEYLGPKL